MFNNALPHEKHKHTKYTNNTKEYIITKTENTMYEKYSCMFKNRVKLQ